MIQRYLLRGNYPNYVTTRHFVYNPHNGAEAMRGHLPFELEYQVEHDLHSREISLFYLDGYLLLMASGDAATQWVDLLVRMHEGDAEARHLVEKRREEFCSEFIRRDEAAHFIESIDLVPSTTAKEFHPSEISHKGTMLLQLMQLGYPVPDFCILTTHSFQQPQQQRIELLRQGVANLEQMTGELLGDPHNPLIFAMRCAMPRYIPGMMPTYLNIGVTDVVVAGLAELLGSAAAEKIHLNNLQTLYQLLYSNTTMEDVPPDDAPAQWIQWYQGKIEAKDKRLMHDAFYQVVFAMSQAHRFYVENADLLFTFIKKGRKLPSLILQKMVWTVRDDDSYPGVLYSRHSRTGLGVQIESFRNIFGEEIMTGKLDVDDTEFFHRAEIKRHFPAVYHFAPLLPQLEERLGSPATVEFAAESGNNSHLFAVLQLNCSELTGRATLLTAIDLYQKGVISKARVTELFRPYHFTQIFSERINDESLAHLQFFCRGLSILPRSAVTVRIFFSAEAALDARKKGTRVCLCKESFSPADTIVLGEVDAILSLTPAAIHVVTACRGFGIPAFIDLEHFGVRLHKGGLRNFYGTRIREGDWITISSKRQIVYLGKAEYAPARFQKYLEGESLKMHPKEEAVFVNMASAWRIYQQLMERLDIQDVKDLKEVLKLVGRYIKQDPQRAEHYVNSWYASHQAEYCRQVLASELGSHNEQHRFFELMTSEHRIQCYKELCKQCNEQHLSGYSAGSFMLGRFVSRPQTVHFWRALNPQEIAFILNEYILFEKYMQVLQDVGERQLYRVQNHIQRGGMRSVRITNGIVFLFVPIKLAHSSLTQIREQMSTRAQPETLELLTQLEKPLDVLFDLTTPWGKNQLLEICKQAGQRICIQRVTNKKHLPE